MKKFAALFMSLMLICSLAACSTAPSNQGDSTSTPEPRASEQTSGTTGAPDTTPDESSTELILQ